MLRLDSFGYPLENGWAGHLAHLDSDKRYIPRRAREQTARRGWDGPERVLTAHRRARRRGFRRKGRLVGTPNPRSSGTPVQWTPLQASALIVGILFLIVGVLGFIPGVTSDYGDLYWAGHHSGAMLLGLFSVSVLHNVVHLAFGVAGVLMARHVGAARAFLIGGGLIYAVLWLYGLFIDRDSAANFIPVNTADNWLHFGLALVMIVLGLVFGRSVTTAHGIGTGAPGTIE